LGDGKKLKLLWYIFIPNLAFSCTPLHCS
jgi:hypothetical protein